MHTDSLQVVIIWIGLIFDLIAFLVILLMDFVISFAYLVETAGVVYSYVITFILNSWSVSTLAIASRWSRREEKKDDVTLSKHHLHATIFFAFSSQCFVELSCN